MSILKTVIFCARQDIPLSGHRDDTKYLNVEHCNPGNFQALLQFRVDAGDKVLEQHFKTSSKNCTYRSKTTQNKLIELCGDHIRTNLLAEICEAVFFTLLADNIADEQTRSICLLSSYLWTEMMTFEKRSCCLWLVMRRQMERHCLTPYCRW